MKNVYRIYQLYVHPSVLKQNTYYTIYGILLGIEVIFVLITIILVLYKKDGRGLHDIMANTIVVKESR